MATNFQLDAKIALVADDSNTQWRQKYNVR